MKTHRNVYQEICSTPTDTVLVDNRAIWYGDDFIRNTPFLDNRPVIISTSLLTPLEFLALQKKDPLIRIITLDDLRSTGHPGSYTPEQD